MCFEKRKHGLLKKAVELATLTGAKVFLTIITEDCESAFSYKSTNEDQS
jgi:hypothetical protein